MATPLQGALHQYVDNLLETILSTTQRGCVLPAAVKYMFDFLDDLALHHAIVDPHVAHTWKSNRSRLRSAPLYDTSSAGLMPTEARGNHLPDAPYLRETETYLNCI